MVYTMKDKYPNILVQSYQCPLGEEDPEETEVDQQNKHLEQLKTLQRKLERIEPKAALYFGFVMADSPILSAELNKQSLTLTIDDSYASEFFRTLNGLLGIGLDQKTIHSSVRFIFNGIKHIEAYSISDHQNLSTIAAERLVSNIKRYEYVCEAVAKCDKRSIRVNMMLSGKIRRKNVILDVEAEQFSIEELSMKSFVDLFGNEHLDLFEHFFVLRTRGIFLSEDEMMKFVRKRYPKELTKHLDPRNIYVICEMNMEADEYFKKSKYSRALEIYQQLLNNNFKFDYLLKVAKCLDRMKRYDDARLYYYSYLGYYGNDCKVRLRLCEMWYACGDKYNAAQELENVLDEAPDYRPALNFREKHKELDRYFTFVH